MKSEILAKIPLFSVLSLEEREELSRALKERQVAASVPLFWVGDVGTDFYIVSHGRVTLSCPDESGQDITLAELGPGHFFGELSLLDGGRRTATARAKVDSTLLSLDREAFHAFLLRHPSATVHIISVLGARQRDMLDKLRGVANVNEVIKEHTTAWMRIADGIATISASRGFVFFHGSLVLLWMAINLILGEKKAFDPYPFFLLAVFASLESIFLTIFVLISQNRQTEKDRIRADLDYQVNVKAHVEVMELHRKVDQLRAVVEKNVDKELTD
ncbi:hypothetical protein BH10PLA1_BH10PLA1_16430 [soil metagenome]